MGGKTIEVRVAKGVAALSAALVVAVLAAASPAWAAATFNVTRFDDPVPNGCAANDCSLREAIRAANVAVGADTINLPAGTHELSIVGTNEDAAATGDLDINDELTINGAGTRSTIVDANQTDRVFHIFAPAVIRNITITGGELDAGGGGARVAGNLTLDRVAIRGNEVVDGDGGALDTDGSPTLRILRSTISDNTADDDAGGIEADGGELVITNTTMSGNAAGINGDGGAIDNDTDVVDGDTVTILNSTIVDNTAGDDGGAISDGENVTVKNTIIANNTDGAAGTATDNCAKPGTNDYTSLGHNLENRDGCDFDQPTDQPNTAPGIAALANNGGPTNTHALGKNSAAVDAAANAAAPATDQRGVARPQDGELNGSKISDIGAFELKPRNPRGCTRLGTPGRDILVGTPGRDVICALGGNDDIRGLGGNDTIYGDAGKDVIYGGPGNDRIFGGPGDDRLFGQAGNDILRGGPGNDFLSGGPGINRLIQ